MPSDGEVGYGMPPRHARFKKGQSGNPKGRPKGTKNFVTDFLEELQEKILVREGGHSKTISRQRAMIKSLTNKALQGDSRAANVMFNMASRLSRGDEAEPAEIDLSAEDFEILQNFAGRIEQQSRPKRHRNRKTKKGQTPSKELRD